MIATGTGVAKLVMTQIKNTVRQVYLGMDLTTGFTTAALSLPATVINVVLTAILVSFLYFPLKKAMSSVF
ncbi:hypothetical protein GCM10025854_22290 [Tetragenococcus muriaticus]|nr:hypothetical protein GCM10025854_22290 [Tetragenococcus muriaticus]